MYLLVNAVIIWLTMKLWEVWGQMIPHRSNSLLLASQKGTIGTLNSCLQGLGIDTTMVHCVILEFLQDFCILRGSF